MAAASNPGLRRMLAAVLTLALTLAGLGNALATAAGPMGLAGALSLVPGGVPICHSGAGEDPAAPDGSIRHGCCDDCALLAPAVLPAPPWLAGPAAPARPARHAHGAALALAAAPARAHRLPRGPPAA